MSKVTKNCSVFGCESRGVIDIGEDELQEDDDTIYICSSCMAVIAIFCEDEGTVSKESKNYTLTRVDKSIVRAIGNDTDDGISR